MPVQIHAEALYRVRYTLHGREYSTVLLGWEVQERRRTFELATNVTVHLFAATAERS